MQKGLEEAFRRVVASGAFILGPEVEAWEREFADFLGAKHAVGVSNGSDALLLALQALGVGPGDEVIVPTYTFLPRPVPWPAWVADLFSSIAPRAATI